MLMMGIIAIAIVSVVSGLDKGIRRLSEINMVLAVALLVLILVLGPSIFLIQAYVQNTGAYLSDIVRNTFNLFAYDKTDWFGGWTIFYWGWWLAWAPFVGLFIARISRGRTIREFVWGVLLIPTAFTLLWMTVFGNSAIDLVFNQDKLALANIANDSAPVALFVFLENFPLSSILSVIAILMIVIFFVTSCDSGAMVVDMLCSYGNNETPVWQRIYWALSVGVVAAILLAAGGLSALQTMTIVSALPFALVLLLALFGLFKALRVESYKRESLQFYALSSHQEEQDQSWKKRLKMIVDLPTKSAVNKYLSDQVQTAFSAMSEEFSTSGLQSQINQTDDQIELIVQHGDQPDFIYRVRCCRCDQPDYGNQQDNSPEDDKEYYRAEVHLSEGGQDYCIMGWSQLAVINDIIEQYRKHLHFLHLLR
jgi:choline/glycine/proline betaine transport protein